MISASKVYSVLQYCYKSLWFTHMCCVQVNIRLPEATGRCRWLPQVSAVETGAQTAEHSRLVSALSTISYAEFNVYFARDLNFGQKQEAKNG